MPKPSLQYLLDASNVHLVHQGDLDLLESLTHITLDSRQCSSSSIFVALRGQNVDGRRFIANTLAPVVLVDEWSTEWQASLNHCNPWILQTNDARAVMAEWACIISGHPSKHLWMIGITGTNGKTTTTWMLAHILEQCNLGPVGTIGTIGPRINGRPLPDNSGFTTPESPGLQRTLQQFVELECRTCIMEVSSIGLMMQRVGGIIFDIAAFTNFTQDHLDIHTSMTEYLMEKRKLFQNHVSDKSISLLIADHASVANTSVKSGRKEYLSTTTDASQDWWVSDKRYTVTGTQFTLHHGNTSSSVHLPLIGAHNIENALIAMSAAHHSGAPWLTIVTALQSLPQTPGRLERITGDFQGFAFVDYAHTPDALKQSLSSLRELCTEKLWVVFGCGGDRDRIKRPQMGKIAYEFADNVIITSDNPRTENPDDIIQEILRGIPEVKHLNTHYMTNREDAIHHALTRMKDNDILLVAGKGHENYQIIGDTKYHFDDREVIRQFPHRYST